MNTTTISTTNHSSQSTSPPRHNTIGRPKWKSERIDLGLAVLSAINQGRDIFNREDLAVWCDCDAESIRMMELRTLRKVRELLKIKPGQRREESMW